MNNNLTNQMPPLIPLCDMDESMTIIPQLNTEAINLDAERILLLDNLYDFFLPNETSKEIYQKIYLGIHRSLNKKDTIQATIQRNENFKKIIQVESKGIIGGADSLLISGASGMGKSTAISVAIKHATNNTIIECNMPYQLVIPALIVQTPFDCSVKNMLLQILRKVDEILHTNYYPRTIPTTEVLLGTTQQVCCNHLGILVLDEIQNVMSNRAGISLVQCITELINSSGISIIMAGTTKCESFFSSTQYLARRALTIKYEPMIYDNYFKNLCESLWNYQPLKRPSEIKESDFEWLYEHSAGITANIITLIHDAQEIAILTGEESLSRKLLNQVYSNRMSNLHKYITPQVISNAKTPVQSKKTKIPDKICDINPDSIVSDCVLKAKQENLDVISILKGHISITEV